RAVEARLHLHRSADLEHVEAEAEAQHRVDEVVVPRITGTATDRLAALDVVVVDTAEEADVLARVVERSAKEERVALVRARHILRDAVGPEGLLRPEIQVVPSVEPDRVRAELAVELGALQAEVAGQ